jgi:hypothetical protein
VPVVEELVARLLGVVGDRERHQAGVSVPTAA